MPSNLGACPRGAGSVAAMRLVLMAQGDSPDVLRQFRLLPKSDANILSKELAITGCPGQHFNCDDMRESRGPALLVYYAPALMQKAGRKDPFGALRILAEVLRQARALWPLNDTDAEKTVLVRIDVLKELEVSDILEPATGVRFVLVRNSLYDGQVKAAGLAEVQDINAATSQLLNFNRTSLTGFRPRRPSFRFMASFLSFGTKCIFPNGKVPVPVIVADRTPIFLVQRKLESSCHLGWEVPSPPSPPIQAPQAPALHENWTKKATLGLRLSPSWGFTEDNETFQVETTLRIVTIVGVFWPRPVPATCALSSESFDSLTVWAREEFRIPDHVLSRVPATGEVGDSEVLADIRCPLPPEILGAPLLSSLHLGLEDTRGTALPSMSMPLWTRPHFWDVSPKLLARTRGQSVTLQASNLPAAVQAWCLLNMESEDVPVVVEADF
eukprot:symbB.v1.2.005810.t1/scaffold342.1/size227955/3